MRGVRPLRQSSRVTPGAPPPRPRARFTRADRLAVLEESLRPGPGPLAPVIEAGEELLHRREGVSPQLFRQLRRGQYRLEAECDLHGLNQVQAERELLAFVAEAVMNGWRVVRIVHGKGLGSGQRGPVLKRLVNETLQRIDAVLAFASAREVDGGVGATLVLLGTRRPGQRTRR